MKYSLTTGGILVSVAGLFLVQYGFTEACSGEIMSKIGPILGALPGLVLAWIGRVRAGGVNALGVKH